MDIDRATLTPPNALASSSKLSPSAGPPPFAAQTSTSTLAPPPSLAGAAAAAGARSGPFVGGGGGRGDAGAGGDPLGRALGKLDELFALEAAAQDHRSASRRKAPSETPGLAAACVACRERKAKCQGTAPGREDCPRCLARGLVCVWPELGIRGPKRGLTKKQRLLDSIRMDILRTLEAEPSPSPSTTSTTTTSTLSAATTTGAGGGGGATLRKAAAAAAAGGAGGMMGENHADDGEDDDDDEAESSFARFGGGGLGAQQQQHQQQVDVKPPRGRGRAGGGGGGGGGGGRWGTTTRWEGDDLSRAARPPAFIARRSSLSVDGSVSSTTSTLSAGPTAAAAAAFAPNPPSASSASSPSSSFTPAASAASAAAVAAALHDVKRDEDLRGVLRNPLAVLAQRHPLFESLAGRRTPGGPTGPSAYAQYYDGGLYQESPEDNFELDPVALGILTHDDLTRLVQLYFYRLRPFYYHLDPALHTADFLRLNSPFLTSALAAVAATYDPSSAHFAQAIERHAQRLAVKCFEVGWKSVEVVQAFGMLAHWASPGKSWRDDRSWAWQGQAMRIASDIRLDLPVQYENLAYYRANRPLQVEDYERLRASREISWTMLTRAEIYQGIQTGRVESIVGMYLTGEPRAKLKICPPSDPEYQFSASEAANRIVARALHTWAGLRDRYDEEGPGEDSRLRERFKSSWEPEMIEWQKAWPGVDAYIRLFSEKVLVVLNLISLRFPGGQSTIEVLHQCRSISIRSLQTIATWDETDSNVQLAYSNNFIVISIAFSAVFLLKLANMFDAGPTPELQLSCLHVVSVLERVGSFRSAGASIATLHAERIRALLAKSRPEGQDPSPARTPVGRQELVVPTFGPGDSFQGLSDDVLSFTWPESFSAAASIDFLDAASWDPQLAFGE